MAQAIKLVQEEGGQSVEEGKQQALGVPDLDSWSVPSVDSSVKFREQAYASHCAGLPQGSLNTRALPPTLYGDQFLGTCWVRHHACHFIDELGLTVPFLQMKKVRLRKAK